MQVPDPGASDHYIKVRSKDTNHPDSVAFKIKPEHLSQLRKIADKYYQKFQHENINRPLSLNDMTLPLGGLFDVKHNWSPPHKSHRDGTDADVNKTYNNVTILCKDDTNLIKALQHVLPNVRHTAPGDTNSALLCESHGRKHIDFEIQGEGS
jgi:hypothetical protein